MKWNATIGPGLDKCDHLADQLISSPATSKGCCGHSSLLTWNLDHQALTLSWLGGLSPRHFVEKSLKFPWRFMTMMKREHLLTSFRFNVECGLSIQGVLRLRMSRYALLGALDDGSNITSASSESQYICLTTRPQRLIERISETFDPPCNYGGGLVNGKLLLWYMNLSNIFHFTFIEVTHTYVYSQAQVPVPRLNYPTSPETWLKPNTGADTKIRLFSERCFKSKFAIWKYIHMWK